MLIRHAAQLLLACAAVMAAPADAQITNGTFESTEVSGETRARLPATFKPQFTGPLFGQFFLPGVVGSTVGSLNGWTVLDSANPFAPVSAAPQGEQFWPGFFNTSPTDGNFSLVHGWDGAGGTPIVISQQVAVTGPSELRFDWQAAYDLASFGAGVDRDFFVLVTPSGGSPVPTLVHNAQAGTLNNGTGPMTTAVPLSAFAGSTVTIEFVFTVPEDFSGPAQFELDNVRIQSL